MKRVWADAAAVADGAQFTVALDGRMVKKPGGAVLRLPFPALAEAVAAEWRHAGLDGRDITPDDLPLTRMTVTAIDRIAVARAGIIAQLSAYGRNDLLCYRPDTPAALAAAAAASWQPWMDWAATTLGIRLHAGTGFMAIDQPAGADAAFRALLTAMDEYRLAALGVAVPALGSLVLGLALAQGALAPQAAFELGLLEELFQVRQWGVDALAQARREGILADLELARRFIELCRG